MTKAANEVDRHVGTRVRMRRMLVGLSQEKLGAALGVTFQQVQKYEKGTNRISASRLQRMAEILGVTIEFFYEGLPGRGEQAGFAEESGPGYDSEMLSNDALKLLRAFQRINDAKVRRKLVDLATALSGLDEDTEAAGE